MKNVNLAAVYGVRTYWENSRHSNFNLNNPGRKSLEKYKAEAERCSISVYEFAYFIAGYCLRYLLRSYAEELVLNLCSKFITIEEIKFLNSYFFKQNYIWLSERKDKRKNCL